MQKTDIKSVYFYQNGAVDLDLRKIEETNSTFVNRTLRAQIATKRKQQHKCRQQIIEQMEDKYSSFVLGTESLFFWNEHTVRYYKLKDPFYDGEDGYMNDIDIDIDKRQKTNTVSKVHTGTNPNSIAIVLKRENK